MKLILIFAVLFMDRSTLVTGLVSKPGNSMLPSGTAKCVANGRGNVIIPQSINSDKIPANIESTDNQLLNAISLVAGTTVGAGILALPAVAIESGFVPSSVALIGAWVFMVTTGLLIAEVCCNLVNEDVTQNENIGILSMAKKTLGPGPALASGVVYVFIHYALLVAYVAEAGDILSGAAKLPQWSGLLAVGIPSVSIENLQFSDYGSVLKTVPVMLVALVFHNIIPVICSQLKYNKKNIKVALTAGSLIPLIMFLLWNAVILGISSPSDIAAAANGLFDPVKILRQGSGSGLGSGGSTGFLVSLFSEGAIITSFIGFVLGLMDFFSDIFPEKSRRDVFLYGTVLIPPTIIAIADPSIFRGALDLAGTFGISVLFGIVPALMALQIRSSNKGKNLVLNIENSKNGANSKTEIISLENQKKLNYESFVPGGNIPIILIILGSFIVIGQNLISKFMS